MKGDRGDPALKSSEKIKLKLVAEQNSSKVGIVLCQFNSLFLNRVGAKYKLL